MLKKVRNSRSYLLIKICGLIAVPIVLLLMPADFFDQGRPMCLSVLLLDQECVGCGITRAVMHFIHFDFDTALGYNKLVLLVVPLAFILWAREILLSWRKLKRIQQPIV